jgi:transcriptional regulator with XRE-family HTH domain
MEPSAIGERLREERERVGISQTELGKIGGVVKKTQIDYEKGASAPNASYLAAVDGAGIDVLYVVTGRRGLHSPTEKVPPLEDQDHVSQAIRLSAQIFSAALGNEQRRLGFSDALLSDLFGVNQETLRRWKLGTALPSFHELVAASQSSRLDMNFLLSGRGAFQEPRAGYSEPRNAPATDPVQQERALYAALLNTITNARKRGDQLTTDQFIRVVQTMYSEYLNEQNSRIADIVSSDQARTASGHTGTHG